MALMRTLAINTSRLVHKIQLSTVSIRPKIYLFYQCRYVTSPSSLCEYIASDVVCIYLFIYSCTPLHILTYAYMNMLVIKFSHGKKKTHAVNDTHYTGWSGSRNSSILCINSLVNILEF